jgi:hypothetical protein
MKTGKRWLAETFISVTHLPPTNEGQNWLLLELGSQHPKQKKNLKKKPKVICPDLRIWSFADLRYITLIV